MKILSVVGARPNFVKISPLLRAMRHHASITSILVHTGQHYDATMSAQFFADLEIDPPHVNLDVGSGSHAIQTAEVMRRLEPVLQLEQPDLVVVVGDVNSTFAAALTATKLGIPVAHVEAGLRSFDRSMPEEINRLLTDAIADLLFVTEESGCRNLRREGIAPDKVHLVGNVMIDALEAFKPKWQQSAIFARLGLTGAQTYGVLTLHRPSNVDTPEVLDLLLDALETLADRLLLLFPVHPRVQSQLDRRNWFWKRPDTDAPLPDRGIACLPALGYLDFVALISRARLVLTDSGGVQEEATILGVPCLTLRDCTERPVTATHGTNKIVGTDSTTILKEAAWILDHPSRPAGIPPLWDGHAAERIVRILVQGDRAGAVAVEATDPARQPA